MMNQEEIGNYPEEGSEEQNYQDDGDDDMEESDSENEGFEFPVRKEANPKAKVLSLTCFTKILFVYESVRIESLVFGEEGEKSIYKGMDRYECEREIEERRNLFLTNMNIIYGELVEYFESVEKLGEFLDNNLFKHNELKSFIKMCEENPTLKPRPIYIIVIKTDKIRKEKLELILNEKQVYKKCIFFNPDQIEIEELNYLINVQQIYSIKNIIINIENEMKKAIEDKKYQEFYREINIEIKVKEEEEEKVEEKVEEESEQELEEELEIIKNILNLEYEKSTDIDYFMYILTTGVIIDNIGTESESFNIITSKYNKYPSTESHIVIITTYNHTKILSKIVDSIDNVHHVHLILWGENESDFEYEQMTTVESLEELEIELRNIENQMRQLK